METSNYLTQKNNSRARGVTQTQSVNYFVTQLFNIYLITLYIKDNLHEVHPLHCILAWIFDLKVSIILRQFATVDHV